MLGALLVLGAAVPVTAQQPAGESAAADLRVTLSRLLGEHGTVAIKAMRAGVDGASDFEAAANALEGNTADLQAAITSVYGDDAGMAFGEMWRNHIGFFVDYTVGLASGDDDAKEKALDRLDTYRADFSEFLAGANPNLDADTLADGLQVHVNQLVDQIETYAAGDFAAAYEAEREAYMHLTMTGDLLAWAIVEQFPDKFPGATESPAADLRSALGRLLGEHGTLAIGAMRAGLDGAPDFEAAANALEGNTADLQAAIASVYGDEAGVGFGELWRNHIGFFVDYTVGLASGDDDARQQALDRLDNYRTDFGQFLAGANPNFDADAIAEGLQVHVDQLVEQIDTYADGDYAKAYELEREAYMHLTMTGDALAAGIVAQFPDTFEPDAPATHTAAQEQPSLGLMLLGVAGVLAIVSTGAIVSRRLVGQRVSRD
ncbi:MAG: copper amine oxidase [Chloroflexota bacterium]|nr:copper amine oxidase [Chloroflexota bacterium]